MTDSLTVHFTPEEHPDLSLPDIHQDQFSKNYLGFWVYLMTDCLIFTTLFVTYAVLHRNTFGGPSAKDLFDLSTVYAETMSLLVSSVTSGFAVLAAVRGNRNYLFFWLFVTFALGLTFLTLEVNEFYQFAQEGNSWKRSAFLSSYFTLVGTHGTHITVGLCWILILISQLLYQGINIDTFRRIAIFSLFWHFLDVIWIFIFTLVYLYGVL